MYEYLRELFALVTELMNATTTQARLVAVLKLIQFVGRALTPVEQEKLKRIIADVYTMQTLTGIVEAACVAEPGAQAFQALPMSPAEAEQVSAAGIDPALVNFLVQLIVEWLSKLRK